MGQRTKQTFLPKRHTNGQQTHEKMPNIISYQRSINQNYNEVSLHTSQNGHHQKNLPTIKAIRGCGEKGTFLHCWWECKLMQALWRTLCRFLKKLGIKLPYDPAIPLLCIDPEKNHNSKRHMYPNIHCCTIYNSQDMESVQMSIHRCIKMWFINNNRILLSHKKE